MYRAIDEIVEKVLGSGLSTDVSFDGRKIRNGTKVETRSGEHGYVVRVLDGGLSDEYPGGLRATLIAWEPLPGGATPIPGNVLD